jgi:protein involved in polysaccharide export with SLBB domain
MRSERLARIAAVLRWVLVVPLGLLPAPGAAAEGVRYALGAGDRIMISVLGQPDISGEYTIRADGHISLHLLGPVDVAGETIGEMEHDLGRLLTERFKGEASVVASVVQYRPVYVLGEVEAPGTYPFSYGLSVIKAIALAGGYRRAPAGTAADLRLGQEARQLQHLDGRIVQLEATIAALDAELAWLDSDAASESAAPPVGSAALLQRKLIQARREALELKIGRAERQEALALEEAESFDARRALIASQLSATEAALEMLQGLPGQSVARREQLLDRQVDVDRFRADELEVTAYAARARQAAETASGTAAAERAQYREELLRARIDAQEELAAAQVERETSLALLWEQGDFEATAEVLGPAAEVLELLRDIDSVQQLIPADLDTPLLPGDVLRVSLKSN